MSTLFSKYFIQTFQILILVSTSISIGAIASDEDQEAAPGQSSFVGARSIAKLDNGNVLINNPYYKLEGNRYLLTYQNFDNSAEIGICKLFGYTKHINNEVEFNKSDRHN